MIAELAYTSVPKGLAAGRSGFCTVAHTQGMPQSLILACESLSAYRHLFPPGSASEGLNPVLFSHVTTTSMGKPFSILSRVSAYGVDYSGRTNLLAHHLVLSPEHRVLQGPARVLETPSRMLSEWRQPPSVLPFSPWLGAAGEPSTFRASAWGKLAGWSGWAGVLAGAFAEQPRRPVYLIFRPGMDLLPLVAEAMALLPPSLRWQVTFSTYCTALPQGVDCLWRCCLPEADFLPKVRLQAEALILDLGEPMGRPAGHEENPWIQSAVSGTRPDWDQLARLDLSKKTSARIGMDAVGELPETVRRSAVPGARPAPPKRLHSLLGLWLGALLLAGVVAVWWLPDRAPPALPAPPSVPAPEPPAVSTPTEPELPAPAPAEPPASLPETDLQPPPPVAEEETPPAVVEERVSSPVWTLALPQRIRESDNTFRLAGLPANLSSASRISFFLAPGFRIARTNGTFFSSGVSGALGGRGSGEMSLTVGYASRGFDDISLRLKHDELRCSARTEWLAGLQGIQFDFAEESSLLVLCTTPWRLPPAQLRYVPEAHQLVLPLDHVGSTELAQAIVRAGPAEAWSARLRIGKGAPLALSVKPQLETRSFGLQFSPEAVQWLSALEQLRDSSLRREWMLSQGADWALVRSLVEDGISNGWNLQELLAPLYELAQRNLPGAPLDPVPAERAPAAAWVDALENSLASVPAEELHAVVVELSGKAQALLSAVLEPLAMLETGSGLALDLGYGQTLLIKVEGP